MNIDDMKLGDLKAIAAMFGATQTAQAPHPFVGKYVICRAYSAGVHAGEVVSVDGENVILKDSRRLWSWKANDGIALSGVAQNGINNASCNIDTMNPLIYISGICELILCTRKAQESINA